MPFRLPRRLRRILAPLTWNARDDEMDREMRFHLDAIRQQYVQSGMTDAEAIRAALQQQLDESAPQVIITTGGTGITSRDSTYEVVCNLLEKRQHHATDMLGSVQLFVESFVHWGLGRNH